jgi:hypothetical protein
MRMGGLIREFSLTRTLPHNTICSFRNRGLEVKQEKFEQPILDKLRHERRKLTYTPPKLTLMGKVIRLIGLAGAAI